MTTAERHGCRTTYRILPGQVLRYYVVCTCGYEGPPRDTRRETLIDRVAHKESALGPAAGGAEPE